jgi:hypothetical protein
VRLGPLITGNDSLQRLVTADREKQSLLVVSPMARRAIEREVLPQLEHSLTSASAIDELRDSTKSEIQAGFKSKDQIYTRLSGYKSIDQSDSQFLDDLLQVLDEWAESMKRSLKDDDGGKTDEVKVKIHVDSEVAVKVDKGSLTNVEVEADPPKTTSKDGEPAMLSWRRAAEEEDAQVVSGDDDLDLNDVRL